MERRNAQKGLLARRVCYNTDLQHAPRLWFLTRGERGAGIVQLWHRRPRICIPQYQPWLKRWEENTLMQGRRNDQVYQMSWKCPPSLGESRRYLCFLILLCGLWTTGIQWSDPAAPAPTPSQCSLPSLPDSPGFHHCPCLYSNKQRRRRQKFLFSLLLIDPWLLTKSTFKLTHILNNVISNMCDQNKMTECLNRY